MVSVKGNAADAPVGPIQPKHRPLSNTAATRRKAVQTLDQRGRWVLTDNS